MRIRFIWPAAILALSAGASQVWAQASASATANGSATIVQPITLTKLTDLAFGTVIRSANATSNTVTVNPTTGAASITGGGTGALDPATATSNASFTVGGEGGQTFTVTIPATMTLSSSANSITVTLTSTGATGTLSNAIGSAGTATVGVGGSFALNNSQASGAYTGSFTTTVAYN